MPHGARTGLAALILCFGLGAASAQDAAPAGAGWTDPPARRTEAPRPADAAKPAAPEALAPKPVADKPVAGRTEPASEAPRPAVSTPAAASRTAERTPRPRPKAVARPERVRAAARAAPPRRQVARPIARQPALARAEPRRSRPAPRPQIAQARPPRMVAAVPPADGRIYVRPYGYGPGYEDDRLERLNSAVGAGYLVMHRRSVEFPDGRTLRVYRPVEDDGPF